MKRIGFITENKLLAQSMAHTIKHYPELGFESCFLMNSKQAVLDAEIQKIDIAVVDMTLTILAEQGAIEPLCEELRSAAPALRILLLVQQYDSAGRDAAMSAIKRKLADDYIFFDASLDYFLSKLLAL